MEAVIFLTNGRQANTEDIKCPFCSSEMVLKKYECPIPKQEIYQETMNPPFLGIKTVQRSMFDSIFACPENCCELSIKHFVKDIIF